MKTKSLFLIPIISLFCLTSCDFLEEIFGGDTETTHTKSYEPITGKFVLYKALDSRFTYENTYFQIDGSKDNFNLKYYENGSLKKEGKIAKLVTRKEKIGKWCDNLHFNVNVGKNYEHISTYTESFEPLNQFRIIDEYYNADNLRYYLSELPYVLGTYVREGETFVEEKPNTNKTNYLNPTIDNFTAAIDGKYELDKDHYFYFLNTKGFVIEDGHLYDSYFQYYSSELSKPIEGFISGYSYDYSSTKRLATFNMKTIRQSVDWGKGSEGRIVFGYYDFDVKENLVEHFGSILFEDGNLKSFEFEHLSRQWSETERNKYLKEDDYKLPDPILYDYVGGTYIKA